MALAERISNPSWPAAVAALANEADTGVTSRPDVTFDVISTPAGLLALERDWTGLFDRTGRPEQMFQTFAWCRHWAEIFLKNSHGTTLAILTGWSGDRLVMLWPLVATRRAGMTELSWLGEPVSQYGDILAEAGYDDVDTQQAAWDHLRRRLRPSVVRLNKTRKDGVIAPLMTKLGARITQDLDAPFIDMRGLSDWPAVEKNNFTPKSVKNRRRQLRRIEEMGHVTFETHKAGDAAAALANEAIALKRAWLAEKGLLSPAITDDRTRQFFAAISSNEALGSYVRTSALKVNGTTAAISLGFLAKGRLAVHIIVYAADYEKAGAGAVLMEHAIKQAFEDGIEVYDLLAPGGGYKHEWTETASPVADYGLALTTAGRIYADGYLAEIRPRLKGLAMRLSGLRRRLR